MGALTRYRTPAMLSDIGVLDILELNGTISAASAFLHISQPTVSRRYRALAGDFGLEQVKDPNALRELSIYPMASLQLELVAAGQTDHVTELLEPHRVLAPGLWPCPPPCSTPPGETRGSSAHQVPRRSRSSCGWYCRRASNTTTPCKQ